MLRRADLAEMCWLHQSGRITALPYKCPCKKSIGGRDNRILSIILYVLLRNLCPMRLSRRPEPFDSDDYIFELKIDGFRFGLEDHFCA